MNSNFPQRDCPGLDLLLPAALGEPSPEAVQQHVTQCEACQSQLAQLRREVQILRTAASYGDSTTTDWNTPQEDANATASQKRTIPSQIGRYRVLNQIARSGQGTVYRLVHPTLPVELVAKVTNHTVAEAAWANCSLDQEARLLSELDHPNVARVYDFGLHEGRAFLVIELVRGRHLGQYVEEVRPPLRKVARILAQTARGLAAAHAIGIVHRDIKPANIVVDQQGCARLIDFGLAHLRSLWSDQQATADDLVGTPSYMAPEQGELTGRPGIWSPAMSEKAADKAAGVGPWTDIFGLGAVLYWVLTRRPPYQTLAEAGMAVLERVRRCQCDRNALQAAGIPRRLRQICLKAMAPQPHERYATADALAEDLERFARGQPRRGVLAAAGVLALALAFGSVLWYRRTRPSPTGSLTAGPTSLEIARFAKRMPLADAIPLVTGDGVRVRCTIPPDTATSLFWFDSEGKLTLLSQWPTSDQMALRVYPPPSSPQLPTLSGPPGTEMVLICGQRGKNPTKDDVSQLLGTSPLPRIPTNSFILLTSETVHSHISGSRPRAIDLERTVSDPLAELEAHLETIRKRLAARYDFVAAVVFPHAP